MTSELQAGREATQSMQASCEAAGMGEMERKRLWQRAVFNPFCFGA